MRFLYAPGIVSVVFDSEQDLDQFAEDVKNVKAEVAAGNKQYPMAFTAIEEWVTPEQRDDFAKQMLEDQTKNDKSQNT